MLLDRIMKRRVKKQKDFKKFTLTWFLAFCALFTFSSIAGLLPYENDGEPVFAEDLDSIKEEVQNPVGEPLRITSDVIGLNTAILNPDSTDINVLNGELAKGAVRYPGSGMAGENANMFVFGHSSHLPVVNNPAYKSFNNIEKFEKGDEIDVFTRDARYTYKVRGVELVDAREALVELETGEAILTLSTCNNFGASTDRFVVEAVLDNVEKI